MITLSEMKLLTWTSTINQKNLHNYNHTTKKRSRTETGLWITTFVVSQGITLTTSVLIPHTKYQLRLETTASVKTGVLKNYDLVAWGITATMVQSVPEVACFSVPASRYVPCVGNNNYFHKQLVLCF